MATTYTDTSFGVRDIGLRTDNAGAGVTDLSAEEDRYSQIVFTQGVLAPLLGFEPTEDTVWDVTIGSGGSKTDYALVTGVNAGQGNYIVRLPADTDVTINPAHASLDRIDELYLVVQDNAYDSSSRALPRLAYRDGTAGSSPSAPGPDGTWDAYMLLATIDVPGAAANIAGCTITDERTFAALSLQGQAVLAVGTDGSTNLDAPATKVLGMRQAGVTRLSVDAAGDTSINGNDIVSVGTVDGVDVSAHQHTGADGSAQVAHDNLTGLTAGDPHTQYLLESGFTKAAIDALNVDADTLDSHDTSYFAIAGHNHDGAYLGISATAAAATKLATSRTISLQGDVTGSVGFDGQSNVAITATVVDDSHLHNGTYYTEAEANGRYYGPSSSGGRVLTISTSAASGGSNGDVWIQVA